MIQQHFFAPDVDVIVNIPLSSRVQPDFWAWHYDRKGFFSVLSAYRMINAIKFQREDWLEHRGGHSNQAREKKSWSSLWKVKVPSKVRIFASRLCHTSLPTGTTRHGRKMADTLACSVCGAENDTWRHSLFDCRMARCVWGWAMRRTLSMCVLINPMIPDCGFFGCLIQWTRRRWQKFWSPCGPSGGQVLGNVVISKKNPTHTQDHGDA